MEQPRNPLLSRIIAVLRAKQFVVFFGIGLYTLDVVVPLVTGWLAAHQPLADLVDATDTPLSHFGQRPGVPIAVLIVAYLATSAWLRCGYIRSIVGRFHAGPTDGRQFGSMLLLQTALLCVGAALNVAAERIGPDSSAIFALLPVIVLVGLVALYADYAIVISGAGFVAAWRDSWLTVRANLMPSLLVMLFLGTLTGAVTSGILESAQGSWDAVMPTLILAVVIAGSLTFIGDVILVMVYVTSIERGAVRPPRGPGL